MNSTQDPEASSRSTEGYTFFLFKLMEWNGMAMATSQNPGGCRFMLHSCEALLVFIICIFILHLFVCLFIFCGAGD